MSPIDVKFPSLTEQVEAAAILVEGLIWRAESSGLALPEEHPDAVRWRDLGRRLSHVARYLRVAARVAKQMEAR